jgi:Uma2 family endonuclease
MAALAEQKPKRWTYEEYARLDDEQRYEIIDGELLMVPGPELPHQDWLGDLYRRLDAHVRQRQLGKVYFAPVDVILDTENVIQPDLLFITRANLSILRTRGVFGAPDLVMELISPSSVRRDRYVKRALYARFGVKEFWLVDPANRALEVWKLQNQQYELHCMVEEKGKVTSVVLPGLEFDLAEIGQS